MISTIDAIGTYTDYYGNVNQQERTFLKVADYVQLNKYWESLFTNTTKGLINKDRVFFVPGVEFPRYKLTEYGKTTGVTRTISEASATVIVLDKELFQSYFQINFDRHLYIDTGALSSKSTSIFKKDKSATYNYATDYSKVLDNYIAFNDAKNDAFIKTLCFMEANQGTFRIILVEDLTELVNATGLILDKSQFDSIDAMLRSKNNQNITLAMDLLSNVKYQDSIVKLTLLFANHYHNVIHGHPSKNSVNFKALLSFFEKKVGNPYYLREDTVASSLIIAVKGDISQYAEDDRELITAKIQNELEEFCKQKYGRYVSMTDWKYNPPMTTNVILPTINVVEALQTTLAEE